ncbi:MAG: hypothetical protein QM621_11885 [Aeromicrobium sp.]|uniref:hypothetical protein n=1 Tax=Aeromicrobium sp. TaxID=1871063 RepID=UPI0039E297E6
MGQRLFLVDVEASARTPFRGVMTEFGVVDFETRAWFHGRLWDFHPHPDVPALPVPTRENPGWSATTALDPRREDPERVEAADAAQVFVELIASDARPVLVSDNPGYDVMWMADGFDRHGLPDPFGHSSRRIGDLAAGLAGDWRRTSDWKRLRVTPHDHTPVNDALGNAEALAALLAEHGQLDS